MHSFASLFEGSCSPNHSKMPPEKKVHLIENEILSSSICGLRIDKCEVIPLQEYLDWGYDGDGEDLCQRCDLKAREIERKKPVN